MVEVGGAVGFASARREHQNVAGGFMKYPRPPGEAWALKRSEWFYELLFGARSVAGSMTPLSQARARARTQIPDAPLPVADHGAHLELAV